MHLLSAITAACLPLIALDAQNLVVPPAALTGDLALSSGVPFGTSVADTVQFVIDDGHWIGVADPVEIQQLRFRADGAVAASWAAATIHQLRVDLSHGAVDFDQASATPAANHGEDVTRVYSGPATVDAGVAPVPGGNGTGPWYVTLNLATPFVYYPAWGRDLVLELDSSGVIGTGFPRMDATGSGAVGVARIHSGQVRQVAVAMEFGYAPATALVPAFDADVTAGSSPLTVQFTDRSWSPDPAGVTGWSWDFDGDGVVDSTQQNPTFVFSGCGVFSPSLTVVDASGSATRIRTDLIALDALVAQFTVNSRMAATAPHTVTFTDTSLGAPMSWAWDFDGDGTVDSTQANPTHVFGAGYHNVSLTVANGCGSDTATVAGAVVVNPSITTLYNGNNGIDPPGGVFFDVDVHNPSGLRVSAMDVHCREDAGALFDVEVFITSGSYVGKDGNSSAWRLVATAGGVESAGLAAATFADVSDFYLAPGSYGMAIYFVNARHRYTDHGPGVTSPTVFTNGDLTLTLGASRFNRFSGTRFEYRTWNGSIYYESVPDGVYSTLGEGCPSLNGEVASLAAPAGPPLLGQTFTLRVGNLQPTQPVAILILGFNNRVTGPVNGLPLPLALGGFGFGPNCFLRVEAIETVLLFNSGGSANWSVSIPAAPNFLGFKLFNQALIIDSAAGNRIGAVMSDAAGGAIGN